MHITGTLRKLLLFLHRQWHRDKCCCGRHNAVAITRPTHGKHMREDGAKCLAQRCETALLRRLQRLAIRCTNRQRCVKGGAARQRAHNMFWSEAGNVHEHKLVHGKSVLRPQCHHHWPAEKCAAEQWATYAHKHVVRIDAIVLTPQHCLTVMGASVCAKRNKAPKRDHAPHRDRGYVPWSAAA